MISKVPRNPTCPTAYPNRRNMMAPRMVLIEARKTGAVPKPCPVVSGGRVSPLVALAIAI
jgi:hypothetical protein